VISCPEGEYSGIDGDCGCFPVEPLKPRNPLPVFVSKTLHTREAEKKDAFEKRKCGLVCVEVGYHTAPDGCGCVKNTKRDVLDKRVCDILCPRGYTRSSSGCGCEAVLSHKERDAVSIPRYGKPLPPGLMSVCLLSML
jgi:hypothetical protein